MPIGFGLSVGDLISALKLIHGSIQAINNINGSSADFASLLDELESLSIALESISELFPDGTATQEQQRVIGSAIKACQKCIDDFLLRVAQYQTHLKHGTSGWKSCYSKIKWAVCKKEDVAKLRAKLGSHTTTINLLLGSCQTKEARELVKSMEQCQDLIQHGVEYEQVDRLSYMLRDLSVQQRRISDTLKLQSDQSLQGLVHLSSMLEAQKEIPPQVMLSKPIILLDACGRVAPFHLEFVDSLDAFVAIMLIRFKNAGISSMGMQKLANLEFTLRDTQRKRPIDLTKPWCSALRPGQLIDMNMLYPILTFQLARLSGKNRHLLCYNIYFPSLVTTKSQPLLPDPATTHLHAGQAKRLEAPSSTYNRLDEFQRVHLILRSEKVDDRLGARVQSWALPDFAENVSEAFAIFEQHMVVTIDPHHDHDCSDGSLPQISDGSGTTVQTMGRSWKRDFRHVRQRLQDSAEELDFEV